MGGGGEGCSQTESRCNHQEKEVTTAPQTEFEMTQEQRGAKKTQLEARQSLLITRLDR